MFLTISMSYLVDQPLEVSSYVCKSMLGCVLYPLYTVVSFNVLEIHLTKLAKMTNVYSSVSLHILHPAELCKKVYQSELSK